MNVIALICADCHQEWTTSTVARMAARELGDGSICLGCPDCGRDSAVFEPPVLAIESAKSTTAERDGK